MDVCRSYDKAKEGLGIGPYTSPPPNQRHPLPWELRDSYSTCMVLRVHSIRIRVGLVQNSIVHSG